VAPNFFYPFADRQAGNFDSFANLAGRQAGQPSASFDLLQAAAGARRHRRTSTAPAKSEPTPAASCSMYLLFKFVEVIGRPP
jgi:hypothetical protein